MRSPSLNVIVVAGCGWEPLRGSAAELMRCGPLKRVYLLVPTGRPPCVSSAAWANSLAAHSFLEFGHNVGRFERHFQRARLGAQNCQQCEVRRWPRTDALFIPPDSDQVIPDTVIGGLDDPLFGRETVGCSSGKRHGNAGDSMRTRKTHLAALRAKVATEAIQGDRTTSEIAQALRIHPMRSSIGRNRPWNCFWNC